MPGEEEILSVVVGMADANDSDILIGHFLSQMGVPPGKHGAVLELSARVKELLSDYDYLLSPEFVESVLGKSEVLFLMKRRVDSSPEKRVAHKKRLIAALAGMMAGDDAYRIVDVRKHPILDRIRDLVSSLSPPTS